MGNNQSVDASQRTANYSHGNHVIKVAPGSPGERGGLIPFFDYLVEANGVLLVSDFHSQGKEREFIFLM